MPENELRGDRQLGEVHLLEHRLPQELGARAGGDYSCFDYDYFDNPRMLTGYGGYHEHENGADGSRDFAREARRIADVSGVKTVLDVGCAKGYFVQALRRIGVEAFGIDSSSYAVSLASPTVRCHLRRRWAQEIAPSESYDLVHLDGILEYLTRSEISTVLRRLREVARIGIFVNSPTAEVLRAWFDEGDLRAIDPLRKQELTREEWDNLICGAGFEKDGILFKKDSSATPDLVRPRLSCKETAGHGFDQTYLGLMKKG